jgi:phosphatidylglycerophosphatase A
VIAIRLLLWTVVPSPSRWSRALVGIWAGSRVERVLDRKDPALVVIDEVTGMRLSVIGLPRSIPELLTTFLLLRLFDIWKWSRQPRSRHSP